MCTLYEDLQKSHVEDASVDPPQLMRLEGSQTNLGWFLWALLYLQRYPLEEDLETLFHLSSRYARRPIWDMIKKIQYLKISWPDDLGFSDKWIMTVDSTHVRIEVPGYEKYSQDPNYFSHKFNRAGINYDLGICLATRNSIWMNGPFKAGRNGLIIFVEEGLEE